MLVRAQFLPGILDSKLCKDKQTNKLIEQITFVLFVCFCLFLHELAYNMLGKKWTVTTLFDLDLVIGLLCGLNLVLKLYCLHFHFSFIWSSIILRSPWIWVSYCWDVWRFFQQFLQRIPQTHSKSERVWWTVGTLSTVPLSESLVRNFSFLGHRQLIFWYSFPPDSSKMDPTQIKKHLRHFIFFIAPRLSNISPELLVPQKWFTYRYLQN